MREDDIQAMDFAHLEKEIVSMAESTCDDELASRAYHLLLECHRIEIAISKMSKSKVNMEIELRSILTELNKKEN